MTPVPKDYVKFALWRSSIAGIKKAKVFPEPVLAEPRMSLPKSVC